MKKGSKEIKKWYAEELKKKDKIIEELKKENLILLKAALKQAQRVEEWSEKLKKKSS